MVNFMVDKIMNTSTQKPKFIYTTEHHEAWLQAKEAYKKDFCAERKSINQDAFRNADHPSSVYNQQSMANVGYTTVDYTTKCIPQIRRNSLTKSWLCWILFLALALLPFIARAELVVPYQQFNPYYQQQSPQQGYYQQSELQYQMMLNEQEYQDNRQRELQEQQHRELLDAIKELKNEN
jgi:hypothetical protein